MPDYWDYELSKKSEEKPRTSGSCLPWILGAVAVLWLITKLF